MKNRRYLVSRIKELSVNSSQYSSSVKNSDASRRKKVSGIGG